MSIKRFSALTLSILVIIGAGLYVLVRDNNGANQTSTKSSAPTTATANYSGKGLTAFPKEILDRTNLLSLDLSNNNLTGALPAEIKNLTKLETLDVSNNEMTGIPAEIGQMKNLKVINYANNKITGLPLELGNLTGLQVLDLRGNGISQYDLGRIRPKLPNTEIKL
ncbi:MAG: leucine-rich repeat domain-containing protein [Candidatus Saccharimonadales bacterium]